MRRVALTTALALVALATAAAPAPATVGPAVAKLVSCSSVEHSAVFRGRMLALESTERMWMRFTLLERTGVEGFHRLKAPGLGIWQRSDPGVERFGYRQAVEGLSANAVYRMRVDFRWLDANGTVIRQVQRRSAQCRPFTALPTLITSVVGSDPTRVRGVVRYIVRVTNTGRAPVPTGAVALSVDGDVVDEWSFTDLGPGEHARLVFRGPSCGRRVRAVADPAGLILESSERDNVHELRCAEIAGR